MLHNRSAMLIRLSARQVLYLKKKFIDCLPEPRRYWECKRNE